jgi:Holliday junction resolvase RusA-like endonuclease
MPDAIPTVRLRSGVWATIDGLEIGVVLPLPDRRLSPNSRVCWQAKARSVKAYRAFSFSLAQRYPSRWKAASAEATFYFRDKRRRDRDNLLASLKAAFDGIAAAGVVEDDADLTHLPVRVEVDRENPRVEIILRRTE